MGGFLVSLLCVGAAEAAVPAPGEMAAEVIVSGRTSTAKRIEVAAVGNQVPPTFSGDKVGNTPGFSWWVSRHYALKTDYPEQKARFYLALLEMAYPHYVELFGREPAGIGEKRMAVCYASSTKQLKAALESDGIRWNFDGGGITFERYMCSYQYPSGTLQYHQRYILLHEGTHLYQMCLVGSVYTTPWWYYEGIAESLASHVYDTKLRRLTVHVFDKPTTHDYFDEGMIALRKTPLTARQIHDNGELPRGVGFLLAHFFLDDPDRALRLRLWRDEMFQTKPEHPAEDSQRLLTELFGPWDSLNAAFRTWTDSVTNTFHYAEWGWEQEADTLWSYGFARDGKFSQTDVYLPPGEKPLYHPLRMDYPLRPASALVGPVQRGAEEPSVGCLVDFSRSPDRGVAGFGLGLMGDTPGDPKCLSILLEKGRKLVVSGKDLGVKALETELPRRFREAAAAGGHQVGITVRIRREALEIVLRAREPKKPRPEELRVTLPITEAQGRRLLAQPATLLSRDGWHGVTPYLDDGRRPEPDLSVPAAPNRWRNPGDRPLEALYRAARQLGDKAPESLVSLKAAMLAAADGPPEAQRDALAAFHGTVGEVLADVARSTAPTGARARALAALRPLVPAQPR